MEYVSGWAKQKYGIMDERVDESVWNNSDISGSGRCQERGIIICDEEGMSGAAAWTFPF